MVEEIKKTQEAMEDVQEMSEDQLDNVVGGAGRVTAGAYTPNDTATQLQCPIIMAPENPPGM